MAQSSTNGNASETSPLLADATRDVENAEAPVLGEGNAEMYKKLPVLFPAVAIGVLLSALDGFITVASSPSMGNELKALNNIGWVVTSYLLSVTSCQPLYGKLSDIFGRKEALLFSYAIFGAGCLACGFSQNIIQLCIARAITGIGGGGMTAVVSILLSDIVPLEDRGTWQGYMNMVYAAGTSTGAPLGGFLADSIGWRWSFIAQAPVCVAAFLVVYFVLDLPTTSTDHWLKKIKRVDFFGAFTLVTAVVALLVGLDFGSNLGWSNTATIVSLAITPVLFGAFIFVEMCVAEEPFAPGHVVFARDLLPCFVSNFFIMGGSMVGIFFAPLFFQAVMGYSATRAGTLLVPGLLSVTFASVGGGLILKRTGTFRTTTIVSYFIAAVGSVLIGLGVYYKETSVVVAGLVFNAVGNGASLTASLVGMLAHSAVEDTAVVVAISYLFRSLGSSLAVGLGSAFMQQFLRDKLAENLPDGNDAAEIERRVRQSLDFIKTLPPHLVEIVRSSYHYASMGAMIPCVVFGVAAFVVSLWIRDKSLKR